MRLMKVCFWGILASFFFISCEDDIVTIDNIPDVIPDTIRFNQNEVTQIENEKLIKVLPTSEISTFLRGIIADEEGHPLEGATVSYENISVVTDEKGEFIFGEIMLNEQFAFIKASKKGYLKGSRTFAPTPNALNTVSIQLLDEKAASKFDTEQGARLTIDTDINLNFPANSIIKADGGIYKGNVNVYARYLAPTAENLGLIMPGSMVGLEEDGELTALISHGMLNVELRDNLGNNLQIAGGKKVEIDLPASADSPKTIPLWHFNETYGLWVESGTATKVGDRYIGEVTHFSTWNLDTKETPFDVDVILKDEDGTLITNQTVNIFSGERDLLGTVHTDGNGTFTLLRAPQNLIFEVVFPCNISFEIESDISVGMVELVIDLSNTSIRNYTFSGVLEDCDSSAGLKYTYNNKYFTIVGTNPEDYIFFGGITNDEGYYEVTRVLCNIDELSNYELETTLVVSGTGANSVTKDSLITRVFLENSQILDIDYCRNSASGIDDNFVIPFVDPNFESAVRTHINKPIGAIVYGDIKLLDVLELRNKNISDISAIEYFINLTILDLGMNEISDLSLLAGLTNLKELDLSRNQISQISSLAGLTNLKELGLNENQISDISILASLSNLEVLALNKNQINDLSSLTDLTKLVKFYSSYNDIIDISSLAGLINLEDLYLHANDIIDISSLASLTNLINLDLGQNEIGDISSLASLTNLEVLDLDYNGEISDISSLAGLTNLEKLGLRRNQISDISILANFSNLEILSISSNQISDISSLTNLTKLKALVLNYNSISDINPLANLTKLSQVFLSGNQISDINALTNLTKLSDLFLNENQISNISPLANSKNSLRRLYLDNNKISDISLLADFLNLYHLTLNNNLINDISPLCNLGIDFDGKIQVSSNPFPSTAIEDLETCLPNANIE